MLGPFILDFIHGRIDVKTDQEKRMQPVQGEIQQKAVEHRAVVNL